MTGSRLSRVVLLAYPRSFRREYGDEIVRTIGDLRIHGRRRGGSVIWLLVSDVVRSAPRMRLESAMENHRAAALTALVVVAVLAAVVGSPLLLLFVAAVVAIAAILLRRGDRPIVADPTSTMRWYRWVIAGAACFVAGGAVLAVDGPELTSAGWTVWMVTWTTGLVLALFGIVLLSSRLLHRPA